MELFTKPSAASPCMIGTEDDLSDDGSESSRFSFGVCCNYNHSEHVTYEKSVLKTRISSDTSVKVPAQRTDIQGDLAVGQEWVGSAVKEEWMEPNVTIDLVVKKEIDDPSYEQYDFVNIKTEDVDLLRLKDEEEGSEGVDHPFGLIEDSNYISYLFEGQPSDRYQEISGYDLTQERQRNNPSKVEEICLSSNGTCITRNLGWVPATLNCHKAGIDIGKRSSASTFCSETFTEKAQQRAKESTSDARLWVSDKCPASFKNWSSDQQIWMHSNVRPFKCAQCLATFKSKSSLKSHSLVHSDLRPFKCDQCPGTFKTKGYLKIHSLLHSDARPFKCDQCPATFKVKDHLKSHSLWHSDARPFKCDECPATFKVKRHLKTHSSSHSDLRPFICDQCPATFKVKDYLRIHSHTHDDVIPLFICEKCSATFRKEASLRRHLVRLHDVKPYKCDHCAATYKKKQQLIIHAKEHKDATIFGCNQCAANFQSGPELKGHIQMHSYVKPFEPKHHPAIFETKQHLEEQPGQPGDERLFSCDQCPANSGRNGSLKSHTASHKDSFKCYHCSATF